MNTTTPTPTRNPLSQPRPSPRRSGDPARSTAPRTGRARRALAAVVLGVALLSTALSGTSSAAEASLTRQPLAVQGRGEVTGQLPFCSNGSPGPCGWVIEGTAAGTPVGSGTFFAFIDDNRAASAGHCVPATYSGVLEAGPEDTLSQSGTGRLCPDGRGGFSFVGRIDGVFGAGRFREVGTARGVVVARINPDGSTRLVLAGQLRDD